MLLTTPKKLSNDLNINVVGKERCKGMAKEILERERSNAISSKGHALLCTALAGSLRRAVKNYGLSAFGALSFTALKPPGEK